MNITKDDIAEVRGETPTMCDACGNDRAFEELEPEEAGQWICHDCLRRWLQTDVEQINRILHTIYNDVDVAKWWFTEQAYFAGRTPHELMLCDHSESLLSQLQRATHGTSS